MEALAVFMGWSVVIVLAGCVSAFALVGTYLGSKALFNEFLKGQMKFNSIVGANHQIQILEADVQNLKRRVEKKVG